MKLSSFKYLLGQGFKSFWFNRVNSIASLCIVTVSLLMVGVTILTSFNITKMIGSIERRNEIIVVIADGTPDNNITALGDELKSDKNIFEVNFYSKESAWEDMQKDMSEDEKSLFQFLDENPLPDCYKVRITDITKLDETVEAISKMRSVEQVQAPNDFASLLISVRNICAILFTVVTVALAVVCFVIISNTTRASVFARKREIEIMRYVGATKTFIEIPFFVEGFIIGLIAAVIAFGGTFVAYRYIFSLLSSNSQIWSIFGISGLIPFADIALPTLVCYALFGCFICALATVFSTRKHLNV